MRPMHNRIKSLMRSSVWVLLLIATAGCGEPLVVLGDLPGFMRIVAGVAQSPGEVADSVAIRTRLTNPTGLAFLESGDLIVVDQSRRIMSVSPAGKLTVLYRGPTCFDQSCLTGAQGLGVVGNTLLIADNLTDRIWRFDLQTRQISTYAGNGVFGKSPDGTPVLQANLASPGDVIALPDGRIAFTERTNNKIRVIGNDGRLGTLAGTGEHGRTGDGGPATAARLGSPTGLALHQNTLYFTDHDNNLVRAIDLQSGVIRTVAGSGVGGYGGDEGPALEAKLLQPWAIDVSADGQTLFFSEIGNQRVRTVNVSAGTIATFAGTGSTSYTGNGRSAGETALWNPYGIAIAPLGFLYIAATTHQIVWRTPIRF